MIAKERAVGFAHGLAMFLFAFEIAMQLGIAAGLLPTTIVWGGRSQPDGGYNWKAATASLAAACVLAGMALAVHARYTRRGAGQKKCRIWSWIVAVYMLLNTVGNALSKTWFERYVSGSVTALLFVCCSIVSSSDTTEQAPYESI